MEPIVSEQNNMYYIARTARFAGELEMLGYKETHNAMGLSQQKARYLIHANSVSRRIGDTLDF